MTANDPAGRRVVVMGLGSFGGGAGAARFLAERGAHVLVTDLRGRGELESSLAGLAHLDLELVLGEHRPSDFEDADWVVANPAVSSRHPLLERARSRGARVVTEVGLALEHVPARFVAVTGTQGKSSTCRMTADLLSASGRTAVAGGNLGGSLLDQVTSLAPEAVCVLELSSYQLEYVEGSYGDRLVAVALLPVLADHLERHGSLEAYAACKLRIVDLLARGGTAFLPLELPGGLAPTREDVRILRHAPDPAAGAALRVEEGGFRLGDVELGRVADLPLPRFQVQNALVALGLAHTLGADPAQLATSIRSLVAPEHRLQDLGLRSGRRVYDNGVSTTPDSTASALLDVPEPHCVLVLGGRRKALDPGPLLEAARHKVALAVAFGEASEELAGLLREVGVKVHTERSVEDAMLRAFHDGPAGLPVVFSPACSSFDAYPNFQARALAFRAALPAPDANDARTPPVGASA